MPSRPLLRPLAPSPARVFVLNGVSSSGKTSLAKAMQATWPCPLHHVQLDAFRAMEPPGYWDDWKSQDTATVASMFEALCSALHAAVRAYSKHGQEVVLDTVLNNRRARQLLVEDLGDLPVFLIAVHCERTHVIDREATRSERKPGLAESQFERVHEDLPYDFEVDTTNAIPKQVAAEIKHWFSIAPEPKAIHQLSVQRHAPPSPQRTAQLAGAATRV